jgi:hypothetical protein
LRIERFSLDDDHLLRVGHAPVAVQDPVRAPLLIQSSE